MAPLPWVRRAEKWELFIALPPPKAQARAGWGLGRGEGGAPVSEMQSHPGRGWTTASSGAEAAPTPVAGQPAQGWVWPGSRFPP